MSVGDALHVVVVGVLSHSAVEEGPGEIVHGILLVLDGLGHDLGVEMIMQTVVKMALYGKRLVEEFLEEILLGCLTEQHTLGISVLSKEKKLNQGNCESKKNQSISFLLNQ